MPDANRRVSRLWLSTAVAALALGAVAALIAVRHQVHASRPIGEGELFAVEARETRDVLDAAGPDLDKAVRALRNDLTIDAVGIIDASGTFIAATSPSLIGRPLPSEFLRGAVGTSTFRAVAGSPGAPITIDGVEEWTAQDVLYEVAQPLADGNAAVLMYDIAELTRRRANSAGIRTTTLQIGSVSLFLLILGFVLLAGRAGASRRLRLAAAETDQMARRATELAEINHTLAEARSEAERALVLAEEKIRIRSEFVLMINHELRTPLTGVVTSAELLMHDPGMPSAERTALLADMVREGERLRGLISRMLTVARIENRGLGYALRDVPIAQIVTALKTSHPSLVADDETAMRAVIRTDSDGLVALLSSLVDNAATHGAHHIRLTVADELGFEPVAEVGVRPDPGLYLKVVDDGPGIEPEFVPRLFEKYEKHSASSGTGLGLYLARLMAEGMDGSISVDTGVGGTTMAVGVGLIRSAVGAHR